MNIIIKPHFNREYLFKILLLGDASVGKSCIITRYVDNTFSQNTMNTIGVEFKLKKIVVDNKNITLQIVRLNKLIYSGIQQDRKDLKL